MRERSKTTVKISGNKATLSQVARLSPALFIDSDTYSSAKDALTFCIPTLQFGTFIILDDYYSYKGSNDRGVKKAFNEFVDKANIKVRRVFTYGMGGAVYVVADK